MPPARVLVEAWIALVSSRIWSRELEQLLVLLVLLLDGLPLLVGDDLALASARFWLIITNVDRKIASSETIIVRRPYGYLSTPNPIQQPNQTMWM